MNLHAGRSADGVDWEIDARADRVRAGRRARRARSRSAFEHAYDPRVTWLEDRYYVTWCNGYHGPTIGVGYTHDFETFHQLDNAFLPFNRNGVLFPRRIGDRYAMLSRPSDDGHTPFGDDLLLGEPRPRPLGPAPPRAWRRVPLTWQSTKIGAGPDADRDRRGLARPLPRRPDLVQRLRLLDGRGAARPRRAVEASSRAAATTCSRRRCSTSRSATSRTSSSRARRSSTARPTASDDLLRRRRHGRLPRARAPLRAARVRSRLSGHGS